MTLWSKGCSSLVTDMQLVSSPIFWLLANDTSDWLFNISVMCHYLTAFTSFIFWNWCFYRHCPLNARLSFQDIFVSIDAVQLHVNSHGYSHVGNRYLEEWLHVFAFSRADVFIPSNQICNGVFDCEQMFYSQYLSSQNLQPLH